MPHKVDISHKTVVFVAIFLLGLWVVYQILDLIMLLFVALILMSAISPIVNFLHGLKVPKPLGILLVYVLVIGTLITLLTVSFSPLIEESSKLILTLPNILDELLRKGNFDVSIVKDQFPNISQNLYSIARGTFDNFITLVFMLVITFYLLLERENLEKRAASLFVGREERVRNLLVKIEDKLGAWLRGQLLLSLIIGVLTYIGLTILQIPYVLPLAIIAGFMEVIPVIGPIISAIPAIILGFSISPFLAGATALLYFVIQQLENSVVVPQVMKKAVGLNPLVVILAIALGGRLLGIGGALLAVPIVVVTQIVVTDFLSERKS